MAAEHAERAFSTCVCVRACRGLAYACMYVCMCVNEYLVYTYLYVVYVQSRGPWKRGGYPQQGRRGELAGARRRCVCPRLRLRPEFINFFCTVVFL